MTAETQESQFKHICAFLDGSCIECGGAEADDLDGHTPECFGMTAHTALVATIARLEAERDRYRDMQRPSSLARDRDAARADAARMREALESCANLSDRPVITQLCEQALTPDAGWLARHDAEIVKGPYAERNAVVIALAKHYPFGWAIDKEGPDWPVLYLDLPTGQVSWHFTRAEMESSDLSADYPGEWDGHTTEEKYERLRALLGGTPGGDE